MPLGRVAATKLHCPQPTMQIVYYSFALWLSHNVDVACVCILMNLVCMADHQSDDLHIVNYKMQTLTNMTLLSCDAFQLALYVCALL